MREPRTARGDQTMKKILFLAALAGCTEHSPDFEGWLIVGYDFGGPSKKTGNSPVSGRR